MNDREAAALLEAAGHPAPDRIEERGNGFFYARCGCGYLSARRRTPQLAAEALIHHMRKEAAEIAKNGGVSTGGNGAVALVSRSTGGSATGLGQSPGRAR